jgi:hypothetical protein
MFGAWPGRRAASPASAARSTGPTTTLPPARGASGPSASWRRAAWTCSCFAGASRSSTCGARSDGRSCDLLYRDRVGETYALQFNPAQRWYHFPRLAPAEAILIKGYDSAEGVARFTAHSAFDDPGSRSGAPERESIEARALVIYPKGDRR